MKSVYIKRNTRVRDIEVSTVKLPNWTTSLGYETCLFWDNGKSKVVGEYATEVDALHGHISWVNTLSTHGWNHEEV
jgi:hypothetical protein